MRTRLMPLLVLAALALAAPAYAQSSPDKEVAVFKIQVRGRTVGTETMSIETTGDSLTVHSETIQLLGPTGSDSLIKTAGFGVNADDLDLKSYASMQRYRGHTLNQSFSWHDTLFTSYRERDGGGSGDTFARPPGHLFIVDPGVFSPFDIVCRMLRGRPFDKRSVNLFVVGGDTDTLVRAPLVDLGTEPYKLGEKNVTARKFTLGDEPGAYRIWMDSTGRMLKLEHQPSGLRVDRMGQQVKKRAATPQSP